MEDHVYPPIGILNTCFREKFGVPRQPGLVGQARGVLKLLPDPLFQRAFDRLELFSHIWIVFRFHKNAQRPWRPTVEPPRLEALHRVGVFATRSPDRPNPIGLSAVKLDRIDFTAPGGIELHVSGVDILDGTPVLDVKPYLPYADSIAEANSGWASREIERYPVRFCDESRQTIAEYGRESGRAGEWLETLIRQMLELDPRPTSQRKSLPLFSAACRENKFAFRILGLDVHWRAVGDCLEVFLVRAI